MASPQASPILRIETLTAPIFKDDYVAKSTDEDERPSVPCFQNISIDITQGEVLIIQGPSGSGKSVMLKCLAQLLVFPETGKLYLNGKTIHDIGVQNWRSNVLYVPQRPALLPGTPLDFYETVSNYKVRKHWKTDKNIERPDPRHIAEEWLVDTDRWEQGWGQLSGGEAQRIALAIGLSLQPEILLLDEPTSALDPASTLLVEKTLTQRKPAPTLIWVTHSEEQATRVATRRFQLPGRRQEV